MAGEQHIPLARELMTPSRLTLEPGMEILDAIDELVDRQVSVAPVVDEGGRLLGLLTEKDCLRVLSHAAYESSAREGTVAAYMSPVRATIQAEMDLFHAVEQFLGCNFPTLPVVEDDRLVGRLSRKELLRAVQRFVSGYEKTRRQRIQVAAAGAQRPKSIEAMQRSAGRLSREVLADLFSRFR